METLNTLKYANRARNIKNKVLFYLIPWIIKALPLVLDSSVCMCVGGGGGGGGGGGVGGGGEGMKKMVKYFV